MASVSMAKSNAKVPAVLEHFVVPDVLPPGDFKADCKYCPKSITASVKVTTNWWKHLVSLKYYFCFFIDYCEQAKRVRLFW